MHSKTFNVKVEPKAGMAMPVLRPKNIFATPRRDEGDARIT
jgi:hypothetical protein